MRFSLRAVLFAVAVVAAIPSARADEPIRLGVLTDMGSSFSAWSGRGSVIAAEMAAEDFSRQAGPLPFKIEVVSADHQNKPDVASSIARQWLSQGVNAILDVPNSGAAIAVNTVVKNSDAVFLVSGGGYDGLTGKECSPNTVAWTYDLWSLAHATAETMIGRGGDTWYFITVDYVGGHGLESVATRFVQAAGGRVLGHTLPPLGNTDYSSFLLQAQASQAKVVGLAMAGSDLVNTIKQAGEFGMVARGQSMAALAMYITDVHALGLRDAKGLTYTTAFYWDLNDGTRAFAKRFVERSGGSYPSQVQAGVYAAALHYLKSVVGAGTRSGREVVAKMKATPTDDPLFGHGRIRSDGRTLHDMYVVQVKAPQESRGPWDYLTVLRTIPADQAFRPPAPEECPLAKAD
jgi:branched-chain amino acid transport system substrate-binding protein